MACRKVNFEQVQYSTRIYGITLIYCICSNVMINYLTKYFFKLQLCNIFTYLTTFHNCNRTLVEKVTLLMFKNDVN